MDEDDSSPEFSDGIEFPRVLPRTPAGHGSVNLGLHLVRKARGSAFSTMRDDSIGERATGVEGFDRGEQYRFDAGRHAADRKSTRLNSSHVAISYAVFCLKKKK